jgi:hypothetical protein
VLLARAALAVRDRPGQAIVAGALVDRLRAAAPVRPDGTLVLPAAQADDRAARAIVMAALVRTGKLGGAAVGAAGGSSSSSSSSSANLARVWPRLLVERDAGGGFGSAQATRLVVPALLEADPPGGAPAAVRWTEIARDGRAGAQGQIVLGPAGSAAIALPATAAGVRVETSTPGVVARVERPALRSYRRPSEPGGGGVLHLEIDGPKAPIADGTSLLQLSLRHDLGRAAPVVVRIPLPPGAALAEPVANIRQVQGALYVRTTIDADPLPRVIAIPLRFALPGTVTWPEAIARIDDDELPPARAPARPLVIRPRK